MADPVVLAVANVGVALTKVLLRACDSSVSADVVGDSQELVGVLSRALRRTGESKDQIERRVSQALVTRTKAMQERCRDQGVDPDLLSGACTEVEIILREIADDGTLLLSAVRHPDCFPETLRDYAARRRMNVESAAEPYFDELTNAVAAQYGALAPWSPRFQIEAFKSILSGIDEIQENSRRSLDAHAITHDKLDTLSSKLAEMAHHENTPSRVFFGSRPDVVTDDRYIERDEQKHLNELIVEPTIQRTVLVGMRGCGKSQLAAALAKQCEDANWSLVAWVNAVSPESIKSALVELAKELKVDTSDEPTQDQIIARCLNSLRSSEASDRLVIFDNVEDINDLRGLVPTGDGLRVVATTTNNTGWEYQDWTTIKVGVFDHNESIDYLLTVTKSDDHDTADVLAERLGDLPLAIAQAAATARHKNLSLSQYLNQLDTYRSERAIRPVPGGYYADDVATALCMAIEDALENLADPTRQSARRQLGALALLAESGVPTRWLDPTIEQQDDWELQGTNPAEDEDAHDALTELIHRSIVQQSTDRSTTMLHRLQAQVLRESWDETESMQATQAAAALLGRVSINAIPRNDTRSRRRETRDLIEQLQAISTQDYSGSLFGFSQVRYRLNEAFRHAYDLGLPFEALTLNKAVDIIGALLGPDHHDTLTSRNNLAYTFLTVGRTEEAITLYEQTLQDTIGLGEDHPRTFIARSDLAHAYQTASRLDEAIELRKQSVKDRSRILGEDHPRTFIARSDLAHTYQWAGRLNEATTLFTQNLQDSIRVLGEKHPYTLTSRNNLAHAYRRAGRTDEAITLFEQVLTERTRILGPDHPDTLASRNNLAREYQWLERTNESIDLLEQSLQDSTRILGENHPQTLGARIDLAHVYQADGRLNEAITLLEQSLQDSTRILGEDDPQTLSVRNDLADAYRWANRTNDAITLFKQAVDDRLHALGEDHPRTLSALNDLARAYRWAGRLNEAITLYKKTLQDSIRVLGEDHPDTLGTRDNLAGAYRRAGRLDKAIQLFEQTLNDCIRVLGEAHPFTATVRENLEAARRELEQQEDDSAAE